jgi:hypothetical protein
MFKNVRAIDQNNETSVCKRTGGWSIRYPSEPHYRAQVMPEGLRRIAAE